MGRVRPNSYNKGPERVRVRGGGKGKGKGRDLERDSAKSDESVWVLKAHVVYVIVQEPRDLQSVLWLCPVTKTLLR